MCLLPGVGIAVSGSTKLGVCLGRDLGIRLVSGIDGSRVSLIGRTLLGLRGDAVLGLVEITLLKLNGWTVLSFVGSNFKSQTALT